MSFDLSLFSKKVRRLREMIQEDLPTLAAATGISETRLLDLEAAVAEPSGDEVLILADHFRQDFRFFISNEQTTILERTEKLFRAYPGELSPNDRRAIQEFLFLCDNEAFLQEELGKKATVTFSAKPIGKYAKGHGFEAARELRIAVGCAEREVPEVFHILRTLGFHVFRRSLENSNISGLFVDHPSAGPCLLINYSEDVYRQRFTAAHEAAHAIFDRGDEFVVSFSRWSHDDLREIRADAFAGAFLVPPGLLSSLGNSPWNEDRLLDIASQLKVSVRALLKALERDIILTKDQVNSFKTVRVPKGAKVDAELSGSLTEKQRRRRLELLQRGLSSSYVNLCLEGFHFGTITRSRLAEVLLLDEGELDDLEALFVGSRS